MKPTFKRFLFAISLSVSITIFPLAAFFSSATALAQTDTSTTPGQSVSDKEAALQAELNQVDQEITSEQQTLSAEQAKGESLQGDVNILDDQIKEAQLSIQAHQLAVQSLGKDINTKTDTIQTLTEQMGQNQDSLAQLLRQSDEIDEYSLADVVLSDKDISSFFDDVDAFNSIKQSIQVTLNSIQVSKTSTEAARQSLTEQQQQEQDAQISIEDEQAKIKTAEAQKDKLLNLSKAQQADYKSQIAQSQAQADAIRDALFALRDTAAISFGDALNYATLAEKATGVQPAFLLAILTQESNLGANVGSCYLTNDATGAGVNVTSGKAVLDVMKPSRDVQPFLQITSSVGRDPTATKVSCPQGGGYGGAMGPSQFIPSTWALFEKRIAAATGDATPDPWNPKDAFFASAIYLSDLGAGTGSYTDERNAACRYYSGRACDSKTPANAFYGNDVMAKATSIQTTMIDPLNGE